MRCALESLRLVRSGDPWGVPPQTWRQPGAESAHSFYRSNRDEGIVENLRYMGLQCRKLVARIGQRLRDFGTQRDTECVLDDRAEASWLLVFASWYCDSMLPVLEYDLLDTGVIGAIQRLRTRLLALDLSTMHLRIEREARAARRTWTLEDLAKPIVSTAPQFELDTSRWVLVARDGTEFQLTEQQGRVLVELEGANGRTISARDISERCDGLVIAKAVLRRMKENERLRAFVGEFPLFVASPEGFRLAVRLTLRARPVEGET